MKRKVLGIAFGILLFSAPIASADLSITSTDPGSGSSLNVAPNAVTITASAPLSTDGNSIVVNDPNGVEVDDGSLAINGNIATVGMKPLTTAGVYTVSYSLVSDGTPILSDSYTFVFNAPNSISAPVAKPKSTTNAVLNAGNNAASNAFVYFLLFLAALVAIFLVWFAKATFGGKPKRRSRKPAPSAVKKK
jgi:methionine-rich copper-binding protein CopC